MKTKMKTKMTTKILRLYYNLPESIKDCLGFFLRRFKKFRWEPTSCENHYMKELTDSEFHNYEQLEQLQLKKLQKLILHVSKYVPYYRDLFERLSIKPDDIKSLEDLQKIPLLTKDMIRENPDCFISDLVKDKHKLTKVTTGGSTGTPMAYYFDEHMVGVRRATWWRWSQFAGVDLYKDRMILCLGAPKRWVFPPEDYRGLVTFTRDRLLLAASVMTDKVLDRYIQDIRKFRGDYIRGNASAVYLIAKRIVEKGEVIPLKAALTSSDALYPRYRVVIEKAFSCKVSDHYGQNEDTLTATECDYVNGFHINMETCIAETVNDAGEVIYGEEGQFLSTHLENFTMPLIRYKVGDVGVIALNKTKCECGRFHQKIKSLSGRFGEFVETPEGRKIGVSALTIPLKTVMKGIKQCQYIQYSLNHLTIKIIPTKFWDPDIDSISLTQSLKNLLGNTIEIDLKLVESIATRKNGKFAFIVSHLDSEQNHEK